MNMETQDRIIQDIQKAVCEHNADQMHKIIEAALNQGVSEEQMRQAIFQGLEYLRKNFMSSQEPLPNFLISLDIVHQGLGKLTAPDKSKSTRQTVLVIGTVLGDPHFLGKNIISRVYGASGYQVYDLGQQIPLQEFASAVKEKQAGVLALSAMMSTTMAQMPEIIREVKDQSPHTAIMVGGAPLDQRLAKTFGAHGYADSAVTLLEETEAALKRVNLDEKW